MDIKSEMSLNLCTDLIIDIHQKIGQIDLQSGAFPENIISYYFIGIRINFEIKDGQVGGWLDVRPTQPN